ncbi:OPI10 family protein [Cavenderia fasciculata]|uniref:OPI10 family protein n=1 Tax=Cavenderia fasciculata TaxID=261658 RepID=F4PLE5_CACFS|nr:OPI10 family protein [Cavenderia fasciculata]EGG23367.1 OPI10 family protein [Cavenderia fasciculata]|eukprot:XP_004361218.1 OPI10 family protein [Cavenderia fasciculata]
MFGYLIQGRPVTPTVQQLSPQKYFFQIEDASSVHNFAVFLTELNFPDGYGAAIYLAYAPFQEWKYLGHINKNKPSAFFRIVQEGDQTMMFDQSKQTAQVGISIETEAEIMSKVKTNTGNENMVFKPADFKQFAFKMCHNFVNYIQSFAGTTGVPPNLIPANSVDKWYQNFQRKLQNDILFWKES